MLGHAEVMRYWPRPMTRDEAAEWIRNQQRRYADDGYGYWLALDRQTGRPVGQAGLLRQELDTGEEVGLGYILHRPFWDRGLALEVARGCLQYAFDALRKTRVVALIQPRNIPSLRVAVRLGLMPERLTTYKGLEHLVFVATRA